MTERFNAPRQAALALLNSAADLRQKEGQFLGGVAFAEYDLTSKQHSWLSILLRRHELPPMAEREGGSA